jgi:hypothetical protein
MSWHKEKRYPPKNADYIYAELGDFQWACQDVDRMNQEGIYGCEHGKLKSDIVYGTPHQPGCTNQYGPLKTSKESLPGYTCMKCDKPQPRGWSPTIPCESGGNVPPPPPPPPPHPSGKCNMSCITDIDCLDDKCPYCLSSSEGGKKCQGLPPVPPSPKSSPFLVYKSDTGGL